MHTTLNAKEYSPNYFCSNHFQNISFSYVLSVHIMLKTKQYFSNYFGTNCCWNGLFSCVLSAHIMTKAKQYGWRIDITLHVAVVISSYLTSCLSWSSPSGSAILCFHIHSYRSVPKHGQLSYDFFHIVSMDDGLIGSWRSSYIQHPSQRYMK